MSEILDRAAEAINRRLGGEPLPHSVKFQVAGEGCVLVDGAGARVEDGPADCTLIADAKTFEKILKGKANPAMAVMTGKLKIEGDMTVALKLGSLLGG